MRKTIKIIIESLAIRSVMTIFTNDSHLIVSNKGWWILNDNSKLNDYFIK